MNAIDNLADGHYVTEFNCPGCFSRMVDGVCTMCGFADPAYVPPTDATNERLGATGVDTQHDTAADLSTGLIDCPACSNRVSESALGCPRCGHVLTSRDIRVQQERESQRIQLAAEADRQAERNAAIWFWGCAGVIVLFFAACISGQPTGSSTSLTPASRTPAQKISYIEGGNVKAAASSQVHSRWARLSQKYDMSEDLVEAKLLTTQNLLENLGVHMSIDQIANSAEAAAPGTTSVTFEEVLATYITLREESSDFGTINQMRGLWNDLGLD